MTHPERRRLVLTDILNAANKYYGCGYLSMYFDPVSGQHRQGSGDSLAEFIVRELRENFDEKPSPERQVAAAIQVLERAEGDLRNAIEGLLNLEAETVTIQA